MLSWTDLESYLDNLGMFHICLGLERMNFAIKAFNLADFPENQARIQVLGTNGKGSTCSFIESIARAHGLKTGLFISPHFVSIRERILIDGKPLTEDEWLVAANEIFAALGAKPDLTYFEFLTIMAMLLFKKNNVKFAVYEAGLGGKNDATTEIPVHAQAFAPIAMDHANIIGPAIKDIAYDKALAIRGEIAFCAKQYPQVERILNEISGNRNIKIEFQNNRIKSEIAAINSDYSKAWNLRGNFQKENASLACSVWNWAAKRFGFETNKIKIQQGLQNAFIPGRFQQIDNPGHKKIILDGGHNPHGIKNLIKEVKEAKIKISAIVFSCLNDKDWRSGLEILLAAFPNIPFFIPQLHNPRAAKAREIVDFIILRTGLRKENSGLISVFEDENSVPAAIHAAQASPESGAVLITGSLYLLGEFYALKPEYLIL